jgi:hypothetical protein
MSLLRVGYLKIPRSRTDTNNITKGGGGDGEETDVDGCPPEPAGFKNSEVMLNNNIVALQNAMIIPIPGWLLETDTDTNNITKGGKNNKRKHRNKSTRKKRKYKNKLTRQRRK